MNRRRTEEPRGGYRVVRAAVAVAMVFGLGLASGPAAATGGADDAREARASEAPTEEGSGRYATTPVKRSARRLEASFPWTGELFYFSLRVNGSEAMRASLKVGDFRRTNNGRPYVPIGLSVHSFGFFDDVYPVDDRADTFLNPRTMQPYRSHKYFRESGDVQTYVVDYHHDKFKARVQRTKPDQTQRFANAIPPTTHDMITWMYDLRRRDMHRGATFRYYVYDGWKLSHVHLKVVGKEELYTPAGWFKAWKFEFVRKIVASKANHRGAPALRVENPSEHTGNFWLSRDENHLPLRITIPTKFGSGEAVLIDYERPR